MATKPAGETHWCLWCQGDSGNVPVMCRDLMRDEVYAPVEDCQVCGYWQLYWASSRVRDQLDILAVRLTSASRHCFTVHRHGDSPSFAPS